MSVYRIIYRDGKKVMLPVTTREEYLALRNSEQNRRADKMHLLQCNYSCIPGEDGLLRGCKTLSETVGMDIDVPIDKDLVLQKKDELGLMMFENSATKPDCGHIVFRRRPELTQEENLRWASSVLGVPYDEGAKDLTRVFFTPADKLVYLDDEIFKARAVAAPLVKEKGETPLVKEKEEGKSEKLDNDELTTPNFYSLTAFDLCVQEAGLDATKLDVWGEHNWHSNLMAVLSIGLPKLMSREQLWAVVQTRLPNYAQTDDCKALISYFYENYSADKGFMSVALRNINAKAQRASEECGVRSVELGVKSEEGRGKNEEDQEDDRLLGSMQEGWNPPPLPKKLPRLTQLLVKPFPVQYHPMLVVTSLVLQGAIASHYRANYLDGRLVAGNLYAALIAGSGKGKNWVSMLFDIMTRHTLQSWDDAEWRKVHENEQMRDKMKNSKDCPAKYHPKLRIMETMSKTSLLEVQTNLGENGMILCKYSESDELANSSRAAFSNISVILRKAWDLDMHRQFYMSEASCNTQCRLNAAILLTGTPKSVLSRLFADTENGMMQRFIPMIMPRLKRTFRPPVFTPLTPDEEAERDALLVNLWQKDLSLGDQTLTLEMPKTVKLIGEWYDALEERYNDGELTEAEADLSHRIGQFMQRAAIPFVALYGEESREVLELMRWLGDFAYYNICHIFGMRVTEDLRASDEMLSQRLDGRKTAEPLLSKLAEVFTVQEMQEVRVRDGQSADVRMLLSRYCRSGKLEKIGKGVYRKVKG